MKFRFYAIVAILSLFAVSMGSQATASNRNLLDVLGFSVYPGAKLTTAIGLPAGPILDGLEKELGEALPISNLKEVSISTYSIDSSSDSAEILKYYEPIFSSKGWKTLVSTVDRQGDATVILTNEKSGMLIVDIDPLMDEDRELSFVLAAGTVDTSKIDRKFAEKAGALVSGKLKPGIPIGRPISVPPSDKLNIQSLKSSIVARFSGQNTVQLNLSSKSGSAGDMSRTPDGRLLLAVAPKLDVDEIVLPGNVPVLIESTDGSLTVSGGSGSNERPSRLNIVSTGAQVKLESMPLVSGTHSIKVVGKSVEAELSQVQSGVLEIEVQSGNITISLPANASASLDISVVSGKIVNQITPDQPKGDSLKFKIGEGKAQITLKVTNGSVTIKRG